MGVIRNKKAFLAFLLPGLLFYILAVFYPIEESIRLSFMEWGGIWREAVCRISELYYHVSG